MPGPITVPITYKLAYDKTTHGRFTVCTGLGSASEVLEERASMDTGMEEAHKSPGRLVSPNLVLERPYDPGILGLWEWRQQVLGGRPGTPTEARKTGTLSILDGAGDVRATWKFTDGWPCGWSLVRTATDGSLRERIEIAYESLLPG
jgi:phage tail-like protein